MKQRERDLAMLDYWEQKKLDAQRALETAERQIAYLGQLLVQHSLDEAGERWIEERDGNATE